MSVNPIRDAYTVAEVARRTGMSADSVRRRIRSGELAAFRSGRVLRVRRVEVEAWLERNERRAS